MHSGAPRSSRSSPATDSLRARIATLLLICACKNASHTAPDAGVDWAHVAASVYLAGEDYRESRELDGGLDSRRPAIDHLLALAYDESGSADVAALRRRLQKPVDYDFPQVCKQVAANIEERAKLPMAPPGKPDLDRGAPVFATACATCHGKAADGVPEIASPMDPPPSDLIHAEQSWRPYDMFARVTYGGLETAMPSFGDALSVQDRWDVVFWLFAERWPPCARKDAAMLSASELAVSSDFDLSNKVPYDAIACVRWNFTPPSPSPDGR
ncbi:MAG: cytochrome c [Myxococcales bacterium]|nr:cytochrome c [Myxococcales bacterium]